MYELKDINNTVIATDVSISPLRRMMLVKYTTEEMPRLSKIMDARDFYEMVQTDMDTAMNKMFIADYLKIEEN